MPKFNWDLGMTQLQALVVNELSQFTIAQIEQFFSSQATAMPLEPAMQPVAERQNMEQAPYMNSQSFDVPRANGRSYDGIDGVLFYELMDLHQ
jgi:hypothetical protein